MNRRIIDIAGKRFGRLIVLGMDGRTNGGKILWKCKCDCGNICYATKDHLGRDTNSCGCLRKETTVSRMRRHGETNTRLHNLWCSMNQRCGEHGSESNVYHEKGISVCEEWKHYEVFRDWALANGYDPNAKRGKTTIDRIDNNKGYSPDNCRFVTQTENARNKSNTVMIVLNGEQIALRIAAEKYGCDAKLAYARIRRGWDAESALTTPAREGNYGRE